MFDHCIYGDPFVADRCFDDHGDVDSSQEGISNLPPKLQVDMNYDQLPII